MVVNAVPDQSRTQIPTGHPNFWHKNLELWGELDLKQEPWILEYNSK